MYARAKVANERTLEVDAGGLRTPVPPSYASFLDRIRKPLERSQRLIHGSSHRGGKIRGHAMLAEQFLHRRQRVRGALHHIMPRSAVNVHINETRHHRGITKIDNSSAPRNLATGGGADIDHHTIFQE